MNYLIFGGSGFIGNHLAEYIASREATFKNIFNFDLQNKNSEIKNFIYQDVRNEITADIKNISDSVIFNLSAVHITPAT